MIDYTLRFKDEAEALAVLAFDEPIDPAACSVDVIGTVYKDGGPELPENSGWAAKVADVGWHVNVRVAIVLLALHPFIVPVTTPFRVWA